MSAMGIDPHIAARLTRVLDAEGLDALVATTPENLQYVTGFRSVAHALFRASSSTGSSPARAWAW